MFFIASALTRSNPGATGAPRHRARPGRRNVAIDSGRSPNAQLDDSATAGSLAPDAFQQYRLQFVVLERHGPLVLACRDLGRERQLALAFPVGVEVHLDDGERVVDRAWLVRGFPEANPSIGRQDDTLPAVLAFLLERVAQVVAEAAVGRSNE